MTVNNFKEQVPPLGSVTSEEENLYAETDRLVHVYSNALERLEFRKAVSALREIWVLGNNYIAKTEPWKVLKTNPAYGGTILNTALNLIILYAKLSAPIIPETSQKMIELFSAQITLNWPTGSASDYLKTLTEKETVKLSDPLFQKILPDRINELKIKYKEVE